MKTVTFSTSRSTPARRGRPWLPVVAAAFAALAVVPLADGASPRPPAPLGPVQQLVSNPTDSYFGARVAMNDRDTAVVAWTRGAGPRGGRFTTEVRWRRDGAGFGNVMSVGRGRLAGLAIADGADRALALRRVGGRLYGAVLSPGRVLFDAAVPARSADADTLRALRVGPDGSAAFAQGPAPTGGSLQLLTRPAGGRWARVLCGALPLVGVPAVSAVFSPSRGLVAAWRTGPDQLAAPFFASVRATGYAAPSPGTPCGGDWTALPAAPERPGDQGTVGPLLGANARGDVAAGTSPVRVLRAGTADWRLAGDPRGRLDDLAATPDGTIVALTHTGGSGVRPPARLIASRLEPGSSAWRPAQVFSAIADQPAYGGRLAVQRDGRVIAVWGIDIGPSSGPSGIAVRSVATGVWSRPARRCNLYGPVQLAAGNRRSLLVCGWEDDDSKRGVYAWDVLP